MIVYARYPGKAIKDSYTPAVIKLQTLIMLLLYLLLPVCFFSRWVLMGGPMLLIVLFLTTIPFSMSVFRKDKYLACISPVYCFLRAGVFAAGSMGACISVIINKIRHNLDPSTLA